RQDPRDLAVDVVRPSAQLRGYQEVVGPLQSHLGTTDTAYRPDGGHTHETGDPTQPLGRHVRTHQEGEGQRGARGRAEPTTEPAPAGGLVFGDEHGAVGGALLGTDDEFGVGGAHLRYHLDPTPHTAGPNQCGFQGRHIEQRAWNGLVLGDHGPITAASEALRETLVPGRTAGPRPTRGGKAPPPTSSVGPLPGRRPQPVFWSPAATPLTDSNSNRSRCC